MNRDLSSLTDLNKTLAQLGFNSGSALIRLSFRATEIPLEEAATQIAQYFITVDQENDPPTTKPAPVTAKEEQSEPPEAEKPEWTQDTEPESIPVPATEPREPSSDPPSQNPNSDPEPIITSSTSRPLSVYRPPSSSTPLAALAQHNEADYTPTIEHAQVHQKMLNDSTRNKRLPTEAEIAAAVEAEKEKLAAIQTVEIKIRMPDQSSFSAAQLRSASRCRRR